LWVVPVIVWSIRGTGIFFRDILRALIWPLAASTVAGGLAFGLRSLYGQWFSPLSRLVLETSILFGAFLGILLFLTGQKFFYMNLLRTLTRRSPAKEDSYASA